MVEIGRKCLEATSLQKFSEVVRGACEEFDRRLTRSRGEIAQLGGSAEPIRFQQPLQDVCFFWLVRLKTHRRLPATYQLLSRGKTRTFKPRKDIPEGTKQYQLRKYAEATLVCYRCSAPTFALVELWMCVGLR